MAKMRAMTHNSRTNSKGRVHGSKHNDRNFDTSKSENIDASKADQNIYQNCFNDPSLTFEQAELKAYKKLFSKQLAETNEKYIKSRHPERCKTMEQFIKVRQYAPEETVLQVGKMEQHIGRNELISIYNDYIKRLREWNKANGSPFVTLSTALHCDEAVPHIQWRKVWKYKAEDGSFRIGQEKALEQAGVPLPHPDKPEGRYNNRKMTFDKMSRELWLDVCHEHGLDIERVPVPNGKHNREKEEMIRDKYEEMQQEITSLQLANAALKGEIEALRSTKEALAEEKEILSEVVASLNATGRKQMSGADWERRIAEVREKQSDKKKIETLEKFVQHPQIAPLWQKWQHLAMESGRQGRNKGQEQEK